jgi:uncharacterized protein (TIGR02594 family)
MKSLIDLLRLIFRWGGPQLPTTAADGTENKPAPSTPNPPSVPKVPARPAGEPKWLALARSEIGVKEFAGEADNPKIMGYFKDAGFAGIDSESTSWCAGFANACLERAGVPGSKSLAARSFLQWGKKVTKPKPGDIVVFWRNSPTSWQGHVGFYLSETPTHIAVLGGNQGDSVKIANYPKSQLLGYREPVTGSNSRTFRAQLAGATLGDGVVIAAITSKTLVESLPDALAIGDGVASLAQYWPWFAVFGVTISLAARMVTIYARLSDLNLKGS